MNEAEQFWNERFDSDEFIFGKEPNKYLQIKGAGYLTKPSKVLCIADGEGRNSVWLAKQGHSVDAFDVSSIAINKARKFAAENQVSVTFEHADCDSFSWPTEKYDAIAAIFFQFADPTLREKIFKNFVKSLKTF